MPKITPPLVWLHLLPVRLWPHLESANFLVWIISVVIDRWCYIDSGYDWKTWMIQPIVKWFPTIPTIGVYGDSSVDNAGARVLVRWWRFLRKSYCYKSLHIWNLTRTALSMSSAQSLSHNLFAVAYFFEDQVIRGQISDLTWKLIMMYIRLSLKFQQ